MPRELEALIAELEEAEMPDTSFNASIVRITQTPVRDYAFSVDACLELFDTILPGWFVDHAGDDATGTAGKSMKVTGHTVELSNGVERVQGSSPTRSLAWCLAVMKAFAADRNQRRSAVHDILRADGRIDEALIGQVMSVLGWITAPFSPPEIERDEDDGSLVLRWTRDSDISFSLTFVGKGSVGGYLIHPKSRVGAWRSVIEDDRHLRSVFDGTLVKEALMEATAG